MTGSGTSSAVNRIGRHTKLKNESEVRLEAAVAARAVLANELAFHEFTSRFGRSDDALIAEVVDRMTHEPQRGGIFGVPEAEWIQYRMETIAAIEALERK